MKVITKEKAKNNYHFKSIVERLRTLYIANGSLKSNIAWKMCSEILILPALISIKKKKKPQRDEERI